jgi:hypothetical protein
MSSIFAFSTAIGPVPIDCVLREKHSSTIEITEIPIETGAKVTDHAVVNPKKLSLEVADGQATASFNALVRFQESRVPFTVVSGLKVYTNMLIKSIDADRDASFSRVLRAMVDLQEVIIVGTSYAADPGGSGGSTPRGNAGGRKSTRAAPPSSERAKDAATANRSSGTVQRGDAGVSSAAPADQSFLSSFFSPSAEASSTATIGPQ